MEVTRPNSTPINMLFTLLEAGLCGLKMSILSMACGFAVSLVGVCLFGYLFGYLDRAMYGVPVSYGKSRECSKLSTQVSPIDIDHGPGDSAKRRAEAISIEPDKIEADKLLIASISALGPLNAVEQQMNAIEHPSKWPINDDPATSIFLSPEVPSSSAQEILTSPGLVDPYSSKLSFKNVQEAFREGSTHHGTESNTPELRDLHTDASCTALSSPQEKSSIRTEHPQRGSEYLLDLPLREDSELQIASSSRLGVHSVPQSPKSTRRLHATSSDTCLPRYFIESAHNGLSGLEQNVLRHPESTAALRDSAILTARNASNKLHMYERRQRRKKEKQWSNTLENLISNGMAPGCGREPKPQPPPRQTNFSGIQAQTEVSLPHISSHHPGPWVNDSPFLPTIHIPLLPGPGYHPESYPYLGRPYSTLGLYRHQLNTQVSCTPLFVHHTYPNHFGSWSSSPPHAPLPRSNIPLPSERCSQIHHQDRSVRTLESASERQASPSLDLPTEGDDGWWDNTKRV